MKEFISKIKTLYLNWSYLKNKFKDELTRLNAERLLAGFLEDKKYLVDYNTSNKTNFDKYQELCDLFNVERFKSKEDKISDLRANADLMNLK